MTKAEKFAMLVQTEILFECLKGARSVAPGAVVSLAMEVPPQYLRDDPQELYKQAVELVHWFFGAPDPTWLPEQMMYEEVYEEVEVEIDDDEDYEEYSFEDYEDDDDDEDDEDEDESHEVDDDDDSDDDDDEDDEDDDVGFQEEFDHESGYA